MTGRLRRLAARDWLLLFGAVLAAVVVGIASYVVVDAARVRAQSVEQAQAQRDQAIDTRRAQTRRIDLLTDQLHELEAKSREQAVTVGRQEQAIRDLSVQVAHGGQTPVVTAVAPRRTAERTPTPKAGTKPTTAPTTAPKPKPSPRPTSPSASTTSSSAGLACSLLPLPILC